MAKYTPKENDTVLWNGHGSTRYAVVKVDESGRTVDLQKSTPDRGRLLDDGGVPWSEISLVDESQDALRIVREASET